MVHGLSERWQALAETLGFNDQSSDKIFRMILASYTQYFRHYHGLDHLADCFEHHDEIKTKLLNSALVEYVVWFHDIVCVPNAKCNEELSAAASYYAAAQLGLANEFSCQAVRTILLTNHKATAASTDEAYLLDIDLAVLGRDWASFLNYERQIRTEYKHVPELGYRQGRRQVIEYILDRDVIYQTEYFRGKYEKTARSNLAALKEMLIN
ncbi:MAG: hypothetical protein K0R55_1450 [Sporomusa sp.]|nr:hypothetical protein [Sporomusa sp.]